MLASALDHYRTQQQVSREGLRKARSARFGPLGALVKVLSVYQLLAAEDATAAVPLMLAEQGIDIDRTATPVPQSLVGVASNGMPLADLLDRTRQPGFEAYRFDRLILTQLQDAGRQAASVAVAVRPKTTTYVRMLIAPSCARCVLLAGRHYRNNTGFLRHPSCDCRHIPSSEAVAGDLTTDPQAYFTGLTEAEQDRVFTKLGAQALRDGADMGRVVNAHHSGMTTAQIGGRKVRLAKNGRLMPETLAEISSGDRTEWLRLLNVHGYIK